MPFMEKFLKLTIRLLRGSTTRLEYLLDTSRLKEKSDQIYYYSKYAITIPPGHLLPHNQKKYMQYDRFLPHLAKYLAKGDLIIDVGANVGDTVAGMLDANPHLEFICIEPDDMFFNYLNKNINIIRNSLENPKVETLKYLVGKSITNVELTGGAGTKHSVAASGSGLQSIQLDTILTDHKTPPRLLKSDVDGFDWDVLDSAKNTLDKYSPIVFFECEYSDLSQMTSFKKTISSMNDIGYTHWWLFDNFGNLTLNTKSINEVSSLIDYVWRQNSGVSTRTIWYFDVLACKEDDELFLTKAVDEYSSSS